MPYSRPGYMAYATREQADPALNHGDPVVKDGAVGVVVKQKATPWTQGYTGLTAIGDDEDYAFISKGIVEVLLVRNESGSERDYDLTGVAKFDAVYIDANCNLSTVATDTPFGRVVELPEDGRGVPANHVRIDLDKKDSIPEAGS